MDSSVIVIQSSDEDALSISEKLNDVGKKLAKLMYNTPKTSLNGKSVIVIFPQNRLARDEKINSTISSKEVIALQNSIRHIVRHASNHGINIKIKSHLDIE